MANLNFFSRLLCILAALVSQPCAASISNSHITPFAQSELEFIVDSKSDYDNKLISRLENASVFENLHSFSKQDLYLKQKVIYRFHQQDLHEVSPQADLASLKQQDPSINILIPFSFLYQVDQGLQLKYAEQEKVKNAIFSATIEKYLWVELGRVLMRQFELPFSGNEVFALDNFSTLMLINLNKTDSDFILDATEVFLLLEQSGPLASQEDYDAEVALDEERYRKAVCLILGKDYLLSTEQTEESYHQLLEDLAWNQAKIEQCRKLYLEKLGNWLQALKPHLRTDHSLGNWLAAQ